MSVQEEGERGKGLGGGSVRHIFCNMANHQLSQTSMDVHDCISTRSTSTALLESGSLAKHQAQAQL